MFSGFRSAAVRLGRSKIGRVLTAVHDPLVVEVLDSGHDGADNVGSVPACQRCMTADGAAQRTSRSSFRGRRCGRRARHRCTGRRQAGRRQRRERMARARVGLKKIMCACFAQLLITHTARDGSSVQAHIEVVCGLKEVVQLDNVGVALRHLLEDLDLIADLDGVSVILVDQRLPCRSPTGCYNIPCARAPVASAPASLEARLRGTPGLPVLTVRNFLFKTLEA